VFVDDFLLFRRYLFTNGSHHLCGHSVIFFEIIEFLYMDVK
jgi:hypothetical protein